MKDPALPALMHGQIACVHAQRGDDLGRRRSLLAGRNALDSSPHEAPMAILPVRGGGWLQLMDGVSLLELGRPDQAIKLFDPVLSEQAPELRLPPAVRSLYLLRAAEAQAALGDAAGSVESVARATTLRRCPGGGLQTGATRPARLSAPPGGEDAAVRRPPRHTGTARAEPGLNARDLRASSSRRSEVDGRSSRRRAVRAGAGRPGG